MTDYFTSTPPSNSIPLPTIDEKSTVNKQPNGSSATLTSDPKDNYNAPSPDRKTADRLRRRDPADSPSSRRIGSVVDQPIQEEVDSADEPAHPSPALESTFKNDANNKTSSRTPGTPTLSNLSRTRSADTEQTTPHRSLMGSGGDRPTPPRRRSVQFLQSPLDHESPQASRSRASSIGDGVAPDEVVDVVGDADTSGRDRKLSLFTKLKAFAASPSLHTRSASAGTFPSASGEPRTHTSDLNTVDTPDREEFRFPPTNADDEGSEADADAEESGGEQRTRKSKRKMKKAWRPQAPSMEDSGPHTAPTTPRVIAAPPLFSRGSLTPSEQRRPSLFTRRANSDFSHREGVSEDEGRERLRRERAWRRRSTAWISSARGLTYGNRAEGQNNPDEKRPSNLRRLTGFGGTSEGAEGIAATWRRHKAERGTSLSAQRWRQIKAGLKLIGQRRKAENTVDQVKSAELLAELTSGVPAALILASMFQRDEHGSRRIPILLEQLKVQITDSRIDSHSGDRHLVFRIELEYGSGMTRMKWIIHRTLRDFANLHLKYKLQIGTQKYIHLRSADAGQGLPRFPRSAFPYLRGVRGLDSDREEEEEEPGDETGPEANGTERPRRVKKRRSSFALVGRRTSLSNAQDGETTAGEGGASKKESYPERQRKKLEAYLQKMIRFLIFRPDSNRLCKFLELSALGVRLAAEGSYHGKEGFLIIQSSKGLDFRKALTPSLVKRRHSPKWFSVRHSYVVCVDSPEEMNIYDVFLVDPYFKVQTPKVRLRDKKPKELARSAKETATPQHHTLRLENSERKLRLLARNERQLHQFEDSIRFMVDNTPWSKPNRFDSFAPVRKQCFAQWLVDGRDHMWVVSRAIDQAKDVIYIHDWWLSPELYMRRPAAISQKWRLDRLLQRKAREGVKVFVIMYRNINSAIPIDSEYSKFSLLDLHPNIFVQRSPNQFRQNTFFWAHHEKICIVDHTLAFVGGVDLCFGRWDTPQHLLTDDKPTGFESTDMPKDSDHCQLWPGKDYSNPRVQDFYDLDKPYEEMYDRNVIPRMPWHDISMHVVGQPARDLTRHFVQRWNYILRQRKPTRPTPFLLPPPDFNPADLEALGLDGTCEVQILRSSSMWSTGTPDVTEHSIMNAYVKLIEHSEHFVYIENQFFISTCEIDGRKIENLIGDALVERIIRAAKNGEAWRAVIVVPLMPGFQNTVDSEGGTSVRLIMQCQYRSICRGDSSIFGRLRAHGIEPEDYIQFFSLRTWGRIGPQKRLVTEQLYIHAKCMVVDDRAAIIGSANINERSMLGSRDSECAAIVRDTDMLWSTMNGAPYLVGRFPHTLRMRLMREHLGIDVDEIMENDSATEMEHKNSANSRSRSPEHSDHAEPTDPDTLDAEKQHEREMIERRHRIQDEFLTRSEDMHSFNHDVDWEQANNPNLKTNRKLTADPRIMDNPDHRKDVDGEGPDSMTTFLEKGLGNGRDSTLLPNNKEVLISDIAPEAKATLANPIKSPRRSFRTAPREDDKEKALPPDPSEVSSTLHSEELLPSRLPPLPKMTSDLDTGASLETDQSPYWHPLLADLKRPVVDANCMRDPVNDTFYYDTWQALAENNTKIYRAVFRCMPDSEVKSWKEYKEYSAYGERFAEMMNQPVPKPSANASNGNTLNGASGQSGSSPASGKPEPVRPVNSEENRDSIGVDEKHMARTANWAETGQFNDEKAGLRGPDQKHSGQSATDDGHEGGDGEDGEGGHNTEKMPTGTSSVTYSDAINANATPNAQRRRRRATTRGSRRDLSSEVIDRRQAEECLKLVQGHLISWPYDWLEKEEQGGNWLYTLDQISPIEIYN